MELRDSRLRTPDCGKLWAATRPFGRAAYYIAWTQACQLSGGGGGGGMRGLGGCCGGGGGLGGGLAAVVAAAAAAYGRAWYIIVKNDTSRLT